MHETPRKNYDGKLAESVSNIQDIVKIQYDPNRIRDISPRIRPFRSDDIEEMVDLDLQSFWNVYTAYDKPIADIREELINKFSGRVETTGPDWVDILEDINTGSIVGFLMSCPTNKRPEDFISWEDSTDNGSFKNLYDKDGKRLYVATLTISPGLLKSDSNIDNLLYASLTSKALSRGYEGAFFESRLPGLKKWIQKQTGVEDPSKMNPKILDEYANQYAHLKNNINGREVFYDSLLRSFDDFGCRFTGPIRNAYQDEPSLNYGMLAEIDTPLKTKRFRRPIQILAGHAIRGALKTSYGRNKITNDPKTPLLGDNDSLEKRNFLNKHKNKIIAGALMTSAALTIRGPFEETKEQLHEVAPWLGYGLIAGEALWIGGAAMMAKGAGYNFKNALSLHKNLPDIAAKANTSPLFKSGFYANCVGAYGQTAISSYAILGKLPPSTWGIMSIVSFDLAATIAVRRAIKKGIK